MTDSTIGGLAAATTLMGSEPVPIVQGTSTVRTTVAAIAALASGTITSVTGTGTAGGLTLSSSTSGGTATLTLSGGGYSLPAATTSALGGIIVGSGLAVTSGGTLSVTGGGGSYTLPAATTGTLGGVIVPGGLVNILDSSGAIGTQEATITISSGATTVLFTPAAYPWIASATALEVQGYGIDAGTGGDDNIVIVAQLYPVSAPSAPVTSASYYAQGTNLYDGGTVYGVQTNAGGTLVGFPVTYPQTDKSNFIATIFTGKNGEPCGFFSRSFAFVSGHFRHYLFAGRRSDSLQVAGVAFTIVGGTGQVIRGGKITVRRVA
jgi:hypothetical protein